MKNLLINLHNHLLNNDGKFYPSKEIDKKFVNFEKIECQKVYAFTDHFSTISRLYKKDRSWLYEYKKKLIEISMKYSKKNINILVGFEIDICFHNDDDCKHLVCIFKSIDEWFSKIENYMKDKNNNCLFNFSSQPLSLWYELFKGSLCIPHYLKSDKKRNFTIDQIRCWNKSKLPKIQCLEIASNLLTYWYFLWDKKISDEFHCIVCNDRGISSLAAFICFNDNDQLSNENILTKILTFLENKNHMITLNPGYDRYKIYLYDINYDIDISKNTLVYGKRGSGKTFLCSSLIKKLVGSSKIKKEDVDNSEICYIKQGDYINEDKIERYMIGDVSQRKVKLQKCCDLFRESFSNIDDYCKDKGYGEDKISNYLQMFFEIFFRNISENENDKCLQLKRIEGQFENFIHYNKNNSYKSKCEIYCTFIEKIKDLIKEFNDNKDVLINTNDVKIQEFIDNLKKIIPTLVEKWEKMSYKKEIDNFRINIYSEVKKLIDKKWEYTFDFDFFNYFKAKKIKELYEQFIKESNEEFISCFSDKMYGFKHKIEHDSNDYFSIKSLGKVNLFIKPSLLEQKEVEASEGQKREFLILKKLEEKKWTFFILDEPEYAFDNVFLKEKLARKINSILQDESKKCWIITHNHVLWSEIFGKMDKNKSYMVCKYDNGIYKYEQKTSNTDCDFMKIYEAGEKSYTLRKEIYEEISKKQKN